ncbi:MAG: hypothetical protein LBT43_09845 [Prevotella sp.]|jgi:hypothetical protein|nr:hypothetical protein [Prevotella sp.]
MKKIKRNDSLIVKPNVFRLVWNNILDVIYPIYSFGEVGKGKFIEDAIREKLENQYFYRILKEKATEIEYIEYSSENLKRGKLGKILVRNTIEYVLLSDRFLDREPDNSFGYFYRLNNESISNGGFVIESGERSDTCKVIVIEKNIDDKDALLRYNKFLEMLNIK